MPSSNEGPSAAVVGSLPPVPASFYSTIPLTLRGANAMLDDHGIAGIMGIDLPEPTPDKLLVLAYNAERRALERRRLHAPNHDSGDVRLG